MQAMPTILVEPTVAGAPAGSKPTGETAPDTQFSQHLTAAGKNIDSLGKNKKTDHPVPVEIEFSDQQSDQGMDTINELAHLVAGEIQGPISTELSQQTGLPILISRNANTNKPSVLEQAVQIQALRDSVQIQGPKPIQQQGKNRTTILSALPVQAITPGNEQQAPVNFSIGTAVPNPDPKQMATATAAQNTTQPEVTIENWRAQFSYQSSNNLQNSTNLQRATNPKLEIAQALNTGRELNPEKDIVRAPVFTYLSPAVEEVVTRPARARNSSGMELPSQPRDANSSYIHSNLPGVSVDAKEEGNKSGQQQNNENQKNMAQDKISQPEQIATAKPAQDTPLIFSLDQERTPGLTSQSQATSTSLMLRLPSGTEVPQSQIVNQVINRFSLNRTLESGTVVLKLHPAELGELRMEIKVEQDNIKAHITTQNPQVQEILDRHLPKLREALEQQGLNLEQMKVSVATDDGSNSQLSQEHFGGKQTGRSHRSNTDHVAFSLDQELQEEEENVDEQQNLSLHI